MNQVDTLLNPVSGLISKLRDIANSAKKSEIHHKTLISDLPSKDTSDFGNEQAEEIQASLIKILKSLSQPEQDSSNSMIKLSKKKIDEHFERMKATLKEEPHNKACIEKWVGESVRIASFEAYEAYNKDVD